MSKIQKIMLAALLAILLVVGIGSWYVLSLINPAQITQLLGSSVKDATGRDLRVLGPVSLRIFPSLGITAEQASLNNASWASNVNMATVQYLELDIRLLPLLRNEIEFNAINLKGVDVYLQTNQSGDGNWDFASPAMSSAAGNSSAASAGQLDPVKIQHLTITDARLNYQQFGSAAKQMSISRLATVAGSQGDELSAQAQYAGNQLGVKGKISSLHQVLNDWNISPVNMNLDLRFTLNGKSMDVAGEIHKKPQTQPSFNLNLISKAFEFAPLAGSAVLASSDSSAKPASALSASGQNFLYG